MISFFKTPSQSIIAVETELSFTPENVRKLIWLFGNAELLESDKIDHSYIGPRRELITPWSTCAVEITRNMGIEKIKRIEEYFPLTNESDFSFDPMLQRKYDNLNQNIFTIEGQPEEVIYIDNISSYNETEVLL